MTRLTPVQPEQTKDSVKGTLDELAARGSALGPMVIAMANSSALLRGYADLNRVMKRSHLDRKITYRDEHIADVVGLVALNVLTGSFNLVAGIEPADARQRCLSAA